MGPPSYTYLLYYGFDRLWLIDLLSFLSPLKYKKEVLRAGIISFQFVLAIFRRVTKYALK